MEPYRYWFEQAAKRSWVEVGDDPQQLTAATINELKDFIECDVTVPQTRQIVARKNLLHGITLALIAYLDGESHRFLIPNEGLKRAGRPLRSGYKIPGEKLKSGW